MSADILKERVFVLAGGRGTRLQKTVPDRPKVLAPVGRHTFLDYLVARLYRCGLRRFVFLLGHRHRQVEDHLLRVIAGSLPGLELQLSVEPGQLGTAGALKLAGRFCDGTFLMFNGDTYLEFDARGLIETHRAHRALVTLAAKGVPDISRFGSLQVDGNGRLLAFREKAAGAGPGLVSAGAYVMEPRVIEAIAAGRAVSLETELLPGLLAAGERLACLELQGAFFDIGTEESYREFQQFARSKDPFAAG